MKPATFAPLYCAVYPELADIARAHGYALAIHGSLARDFDLICIPWTDAPSAPEEVIAAMGKHFVLAPQARTQKAHGRVAYTLSLSWGECFVDLSFMPRAPEASQAQEERAHA